MNTPVLRYHAYRRDQHVASFATVEDAVFFVIANMHCSLRYELDCGAHRLIWINSGPTAFATVEQGVEFALEWQSKIGAVAA